MLLKKGLSSTSCSYNLGYEGVVKVVVQRKDGDIIHYRAINDLTTHGMISIFENLSGVFDRSFSYIKLGLMPAIDNCDLWSDATSLEDIGTEVKIKSTRLRSTNLSSFIEGGYNTVSFSVNFAIRANEGNGERFNCMGLYLDDDKLFALVRFAEITKIEDINIIVQWKLTLKSIKMPISAMEIIAKNMVKDSVPIDAVELYDGGVLVGMGDMSVSMTEPERTNIIPMSNPPIATDSFYLVSDLHLSAVIDDEAINGVDRIVIKAGDEIFDDILTNGWTFSNVDGHVRNAFVYKIKLWERLRCKEMLQL